MRLLTFCAVALLLLSVTSDAALLQPPPADTYADEGINAAGWGNILWAAIAIVALVAFVALAMFGLRSTKRSRVGD